MSWSSDASPQPEQKGRSVEDDRIRRLIADESAPFRQSLRAMLRTTPDMRVVGEAICGPSIAQRLIQHFSGHVPGGRPHDLFPELTEREREILALMAQRLTNQEIAEWLVLNNKTTRNHVSNIFSKLQVADRARRSCALVTRGCASLLPCQIPAPAHAPS